LPFIIILLEIEFYFFPNWIGFGLGIGFSPSSYVVERPDKKMEPKKRQKAVDKRAGTTLRSWS
jgi:hypothetical protein